MITVYLILDFNCNTVVLICISTECAGIPVGRLSVDDCGIEVLFLRLAKDVSLL
jgi:hypothetical protein